MFAQLVFAGLVVGSLYALVALGFTLIYKATEVVNFAHGEILMLGAYVALTLMVGLGLPFPVALPVTLALAALFGLLLNWSAIRPLMDASLLSQVIALLGIASIVKGTVRNVWGVQGHYFPPPLPTDPLSLGGVLATPQDLAVIGVTLACIAALYVFYEHTRVGLAMRGTSQNRKAAALMGIDVPKVFALAWAAGAVLSALGGVFLAPLVVVDPDMGEIGMKAFAAVVLGGFGSLPGAIVGGVLLGVAENLVAGYVSSQVQLAVPFLLMVAVLTIYPSGLFGRTVRQRV